MGGWITLRSMVVDPDIEKDIACSRRRPEVAAVHRSHQEHGHLCSSYRRVRAEGAASAATRYAAVVQHLDVIERPVVVGHVIETR